MYHASIDSGGRATAFWHSDLHAPPADAIPIGDDTWAAWIADTAGQRWDGTRLVPCDPPPPPPAPPIRMITPLAFRRRIGPERRAAITLAASQAMQAGDATIQTWLDDLAASRVVDLDDPELLAGVAVLLGADLITAAERDALLADGQPTERA